MKILSIGNSFSQDAHRYLHRLAEQDGTELMTVNLFIGGCSLQGHDQNMIEDNAAYDYERNGDATGIKISIRQALVSEDWDVVTLQQASHFSGHYHTYLPYIQALADCIRQYCPHTQIWIHQTWAYEDGSERLKNAEYASAEQMLSAVCDAYKKAAQSIRADGIIPCGEAMMRAVEMGIGKIHRDTFHASLGVGRYLLALCWYKALTGKDITHNRFADFDEPISEREREIVIKSVDAVCK